MGPGGGSWPGARPSSQLLQGDLNLAIVLPHVQQEGDVVAVVLDDVVVHVDQDSGREERWLDCGRPFAFKASGDKEDRDGYYTSGTPKFSSVSHFLSDPHSDFQWRAQCPRGRATTQTRPASYHAPDCARVPLSVHMSVDTFEQLKVDLGKTQCSSVTSRAETPAQCESECRRCGGWTVETATCHSDVPEPEARATRAQSPGSWHLRAAQQTRGAWPSLPTGFRQGPGLT